MAGVENKYDRRYAETDCYWGTKPSVLCDQLLQVMAELRIDPANNSLIDLGCGEGRNAIYLASKGFQVTALDLSPVGLEKTRRYAGKKGVEVKTIEANISDCVLEQEFECVFSTGTVHYIAPELRPASFSYFQSKTICGGLHAISALVSKPFIKHAPDAEDHVTLFESGELMSYYKHWRILHTIETIFDCNSGGTPHRHAVNRIIARRPDQNDARIEG